MYNDHNVNILGNHIDFKFRDNKEERWRHRHYNTEKMFHIWTQGNPTQGEWDMAQIGKLANQFEREWSERSRKIVWDIENQLIERLAAEHAALQEKFNQQALENCLKQDQVA
jgi:hypothetical protein